MPVRQRRQRLIHSAGEARAAAAARRGRGGRAGRGEATGRGWEGEGEDYHGACADGGDLSGGVEGVDYGIVYGAGDESE